MSSSRLRSRVTKFQSIFSYYGGKSNISHLYPKPEFGKIIEPFCGAASYSARWWSHDVHLYDADPVTASIWKFLLGQDATECIRMIPVQVRAGQLVTDIMPPDTPDGLIRLLQSEANVGTQGARGVHNQITKFGEKGWTRIKMKLEFWMPRIRHWKFDQLHYGFISNQEAVWFVDPPYNNEAGKRYRTQIEHYDVLGDWCKSRQGQLIVCENYGADWLPFEPLVPRRGVHSSYQKSNAMEAVYARSQARNPQATVEDQETHPRKP